MARSYSGYYRGLSIRRREFDSPTSRQIYRRVASVLALKQHKCPGTRIFHSSTAVVQLAVNQLVVGSIPACGAISLLGDRLVWPKATVFEIVIVGSNPTPSAKSYLGVLSVRSDGSPWK